MTKYRNIMNIENQVQGPRLTGGLMIKRGWKKISTKDELLEKMPFFKKLEVLNSFPSVSFLFLLKFQLNKAFKK